MCLNMGPWQRNVFEFVGETFGFGCFVFEIRSLVAQDGPYVSEIHSPDAERIGLLNHTWPFLLSGKLYLKPR